jgi:hypothetical protein
MGFRITDREIDEMIRQESLDEPMAVEVVRKGGAGQGEAPPEVVSAPRTVIDAFLSPREEPLGRQYLVDLSAVGRVRLASRSRGDVYVLYSESADPGPLDPGDWIVLKDEDGTPISASSATSDAGDDLRWAPIPPEERTRVRLIISTSQTEPQLDNSILDGPFSVALQVDVE